jgi:hypothetical protein
MADLSEKIIPARVFIAVVECPNCKDGLLNATGNMSPLDGKRFEHKCTVCKTFMFLPISYPQSRIMEIPKDILELERAAILSAQHWKGDKNNEQV